jgi:hypothetical protein
MKKIIWIIVLLIIAFAAYSIHQNSYVNSEQSDVQNQTENTEENQDNNATDDSGYDSGDNTGVISEQESADNEINFGYTVENPLTLDPRIKDTKTAIDGINVIIGDLHKNRTGIDCNVESCEFEITEIINYETPDGYIPIIEFTANSGHKYYFDFSGIEENNL